MEDPAHPALRRLLVLQLLQCLLVRTARAPFTVANCPRLGPSRWLRTLRPMSFLFIGSNCTPTFALDSGAGRAVIGYKDEGRYESGKWIPGRRLNGDESGRGLPGDGVIGMLRVKLFRLE